MKNLNFYMLAAAGCLALASCSEDDSSSNNGNVSADLVGTYELTKANAPTAQDYDGDGDSNSNLVLEGSCYNDSWISFHEDGTYEEGYNTSTMGEGGLSLECESQVSSGTYTRDGNTINTTRTSGSGNASAAFTFNSNSHTLTRNQSNSAYSAWNSATSLWASLTGNLELTYTKYTDNEDDNGNSQDDDDNVSSSSRAELIGDFELTSLLGGSAQDLDDDGDSSSNLVDESSCYGESHIIFKNDGTYEEHSSSNTIGSLGLTLDCNSDTHTGTWTRNGNDIITRSSGTGSVTTHYTLDTQSNTISRTEENGQYPSFNSATSLFTMLTSNLSYEFMRNSEDAN